MMIVQIKGIKMPETCKLCPLSEFDARNYVIVCKASGYLIDYHLAKTTRPPMICPIVEVPPHGRLIDADALHKLFEDQWHYLQVLDWNENPTAEARQSGVNWCINTMHDSAPTVIPASESKERPAFLPTYELTPRKTNADRIRRMSDKELAELLVSTDGDFPPNCEDVPVRKLEAYWLDWLRQEAGNG